MKRILLRFTTVALITVAFSSQVLLAQNAQAAKDKLATRDYLVGTWSCAHQVGDFSGKYTTTYEKVMGDLWLRETYDFPPGQFGGVPQQQAVSAEALIGYDGRRDQWVRFFVSSSGDYFPIRMKDTGDGWTYQYVSFFSGKWMDKTAADATFTKKSDTEYTIDGPTYPENGKQVTEHHQCRKQ
jgi:hypothetical protein